MGDVLIPSLMVGDCCERICVRVSRYWDFYDPQDEKKLLHSDLVLIDEEGNSIHAQMYPPIHELFKPVIEEGSVYNLSYFRVKRSNKSYKPVANHIIINFTKWTLLEKVIEIPPGFPLYTYSLTPINQIRSRIHDREYFTDVIGVVSVISNTSSLRARARLTDSLKRVVTIHDAGGASVEVVLWSERATSFPAEQVHKDGQSSPQVVIFVGTLVKSYAGGVSLSGGSSCKWYLNPSIPEANNLIASARNMHQPIKWDEQMTSSEPTPAAEPKKISDIKTLHPFKDKKKESLVTVTIKKIDNSWWYNACKKCLRTAKPHGDSYKCSEPSCDAIGAPTQRYKLCVIAGDETGDTEFVLFGRIAQRLTKKSAETLIAENPRGFIPDEITRLLEKVFIWNVSLTANTISSGNVGFQVNAVVGEIDAGNIVLPMTPAGSQSSSFMLSQGAGSSMQNTPPKSNTIVSSSVPAISQGSHASTATPSKTSMPATELPVTPQSGRHPTEDETAAHKDIDIPLLPPEANSEIITASATLAKSPATPNESDDITVSETAPASNVGKDVHNDSSTKTQKSTTRKRSCPSPNKRTTKKLFSDQGVGDEDDEGYADDAAKPSAGHGA